MFGNAMSTANLPNYMYHLTRKELVPKILREGIIPSLGHNTESVGDMPGVYLCPGDDVWCWAIQLGRNALIRISTSKCEEIGFEESDYGFHSKEWFTTSAIPAEAIEEVEMPPVTKDQMAEFTKQLMWTLSGICCEAARILQEIAELKKNNYVPEFAMRNELYGLSMTAAIYTGILSRTDTLALSVRHGTELLLKEIGDGSYAFCDTYMNTKRRLWEILDDESIPEQYRKETGALKKAMQVKLEPYLYLNTGGFSG